MRKLLVGCLLWLSLPAHSQLRELHFNTLTVEDGLPEDYSTCSLQDKFGYVWFGTQNGLVRYDGYNVKVYKLENADGRAPAYRSIWCIAEAPDGTIWVGGAKEGIFRLNRTTEKFDKFKHAQGGRHNSFTEQYGILKIDHEGFIWVGSWEPSKQVHLDRLDPKSGEMVSYDSVSNGQFHLPSSVLTDLMVDKNGTVWTGGNHGLHRFDYKTKRFTTIINNPVDNIYEAPSEPGILWFVQLEGLKNVLTRYDTRSGATEMFRRNANDPRTIHSDSVSSIFESSNGSLWIGTKNGVTLLDRKAKVFKSYVPGNPFPEDSLANVVVKILEGRNGQLWMRTRSKGLFYLSNPSDTLRRFVYNENQPNGLSANTTLPSSFVDRDKNVWINTRLGGIGRLDEKASRFAYVEKSTEPGGYPGGALIGISKLDKDHDLLLTWKGLFKFDRSKNTYSQVDLKLDPLKKTTFSTLLVDKSGVAWLSSGQGLFSYNDRDGKVTQYVHKPEDSLSISNTVARTFLEDSKGNFWVGTYGGGLNKLDRKTGKFTRYPFTADQSKIENGVLDDDQVITIMEDRHGVIWVGTNNGGLNRMDPVTGKFKSYFNNDEGFQCVLSICEDAKGRFWVGTYLWGLFIFDPATGHWQRMTEKEGLAFDQVLSVKQDESGRMWLASPRGFSIIDPNTLAISYLNKSNGLPANDFIGNSISEWDGDWVVGTKRGFIRFKPDQLLKNDQAPNVLLQSVAFSHGNSDSTLLLTDQKELSFDYNENRLQFQFVGIHYSNPGLNKYQYMLEGYDKNWVDGGASREALYTNLSPGKYRFLVKAANSDGVWSKEPATIEIVIHPPWWKTWLAYVLYAIIIGLGLAGFMAYRSKKLRRQNKVLEEKVEHRTAQLKQSIEELKTTQTQLVQAEKMASLGELTAGIAHEIQNPLNFINNFSEVSSELVDEMNDELAAGNTEDVKAIAEDLNKNLEKIVFHGKRADSIVKNMLQHSRQSTGQKEPTDINALVDEYLRLSYHGLRAKDKSFNAIMETHFDPAIGKLPMVAQDIGRVLLNLFNNAFYSVMDKKRRGAPGFEPTLYVTTQKIGNRIEIQVKDNGMGIPQKVLDKIYQPFFTTKPTGEGTGLGLSMSYDIITKGHGGTLNAHTKEGEYAQFDISLPA